MEVPGLGRTPLNINNAIRTVPEVIPNPIPESLVKKTAPKTEDVSPFQQLLKTPAVTENLQTFANILAEINIPNTPQNNNLAQVLANYNQPINRETMTLVSKALGGLMNKSPADIEAGVVLLINGLNITNESVSSVKQLLQGGSLSQNLLSFSKEIQKFVETVNKQNFGQEITKQIQQGHINSNPIITIADNSQALNTLASQQAGLVSSISSKDNTDKVKMDTTAIKVDTEKIDTINTVNLKNQNQENNQVKVNKNSKNPTDEDYKINEIKKAIKEESNEDGQSKKNKNVSKIITENSTFENKLLENKINPQNVLGKLSIKAQDINKNIINLLTIDILKNPDMFPMQISMIKKYFSELEIDVKEFKEIIKENFPQLLNKIGKEENSEKLYSNLLKLIYQKDENKNELKSLQNFDLDFITNLIRTAEKINLNIIGRETLTKSTDVMCLPITVLVNGNFKNIEILIQREDQSDKKVDVGEVPLKIQLSLETNTLGKVVVDINNWKKDLRINLLVENTFIQNKVKENISILEDGLKELPFDLQTLSCMVSPRQNENTSILLPKKYKTYSLKRIEGIA